MKKVMVIYESKYGNTKLVAEIIAEGMKEAGGAEPTLSSIKEVDFDKIADYDAILIGSPNHIGGPVGRAKKFIDKVGQLNLKEKQVAVFDTYMGKDFQKAVKKMEKRISQKAPHLKLAAAGLSIQVQGLKGPLSEDQLPLCRDFGGKIAAKMSA